MNKRICHVAIGVMIGSLLALFGAVLLPAEVEASGPIEQSSDPTIAQSIEWDDCDSHKWIAESWGDGIVADWVEFNGRQVLRARTTPTGSNWALLRTDRFPSENWETATELRASIFQEGGPSGLDVKLEVRGQDFDKEIIESIYCYDLQPGAWNTCAWRFSSSRDYSEVSYLSLVLDHLSGGSSTFYIDDLRLVSSSGEDEWDDMDDGSRNWFYFGNWVNWALDHMFGFEPVTHSGGNPETPAGSIYVEWDYHNGCCHPEKTAEIGTSNLQDGHDWSSFNRIAVDVKVSDPAAPISVFFWNSQGITTPVDYRGFGTSTQRAAAADTWQTLTWDLPWPTWFDNTSIDEIKFIVNDIDTHQQGNLYIDNIRLLSSALPAPVDGLTYVLEDFDDQSHFFNDFSGNWGILDSTLIITDFDTGIYFGPEGASLRVDYALEPQSYGGVWQSLWGHSDYTQTRYIDFTDIYGALTGESKDFEQLQFWVRGSGATTDIHNVKVELKDATGDYDRTAYRYIAIDDSDTTWQQIVLDADVTNSSFWSYNGYPPDPTKMKQLVFVIEQAFNNSQGAFYIDDICFIDADDQAFVVADHTDDQFLDFISQVTFQYFLDWYDPVTGLFQDRSTFPDLMSTASTGFGLTALTIGESRGWIERNVAVDMIRHSLTSLLEGHSSSDTVTQAISGTNGYKGFYYHFLDTDGNRKFDDEGTGSELSSVDTALLMAGILTVREHFNDDAQIVNLADQLFNRVEWDWMLDPATDWFYMAWKPEQETDYSKSAPAGGHFSAYSWDFYTDEAILINLLAIGAPTHSVPAEVFYKWEREWGDYQTYHLVQSWNGSFFTYVFAHLWLDFCALGTDNHPMDPVNWWDNSVQAALANWRFVREHEDDTAFDEDEDFTTYVGEGWGLTAAEGPDHEYHAYGALPAHIDPDHDGTLAPYGAGMGVLFLPDESISALKAYFADDDLWRYRFGFGDAYNLDFPGCDDPWYHHVAFGIDQGPMLLAIENYRSRLIWRTLARNPSIQDALGQIFGYQHMPITVRAPMVLSHYDSVE